MITPQQTIPMVLPPVSRANCGIPTVTAVLPPSPLLCSSPECAHPGWGRGSCPELRCQLKDYLVHICLPIHTSHVHKQWIGRRNDFLVVVNRTISSVRAVTFPAAGHYHHLATLQNYAARRHRHVCVNKLPGVITSQWNGQKSNQWSLIHKIHIHRHIHLIAPAVYSNSLCLQRHFLLQLCLLPLPILLLPSFSLAFTAKQPSNTAMSCHAWSEGRAPVTNAFRCI